MTDHNRRSPCCVDEALRYLRVEDPAHERDAALGAAWRAAFEALPKPDEMILELRLLPTGDGCFAFAYGEDAQEGFGPDPIAALEALKIAVDSSNLPSPVSLGSSARSRDHD